MIGSLNFVEEAVSGMDESFFFFFFSLPLRLPLWATSSWTLLVARRTDARQVDAKDAMMAK